MGRVRSLPIVAVETDDGPGLELACRHKVVRALIHKPEVEPVARRIMADAFDKSRICACKAERKGER